MSPNFSFWRVFIFWNLTFFGYAILISIFLNTIFSLALHFNNFDIFLISLYSKYKLWSIIGLTIAPFFAIKTSLNLIQKDLIFKIKNRCKTEFREINELQIADIRQIWRNWTFRTLVLTGLIIFIEKYFFANYITEDIILISLIILLIIIGGINMWIVLNKMEIKN